MILKELLSGLEYEVLQGTTDTDISSLIYDSRKAATGAAFVCISGSIRDAHDFIPQVVEAGASAVIAEKNVDVPKSVTLIKVSDGRLALAIMSANWFGHPAERLKTIGVTGTKGKTTTTYMIKSILEKGGHKVGLIGTIETIIGDKVIPSVNTTPESYLIQQYFREMADEGCDCVVMEVSSQGLMLHRVAGFTFDYGVFTNLEPDHIGENEHKDFNEYMHCKGMLFKQCRHGIVNIDCIHTESVLEGHTCTVETFGYSEKADLRASDVTLYSKQAYLGVIYQASGLLDAEIEVDIPGNFTVYNSLTAIAVCLHFGVSAEDILSALKTIRVKGREELIPISSRFSVMVDYAHNAMALESLLTSLRRYNPKRLVCMFGCGGNRDKQRRFEMGEVSSKYADFTVVTSDNPRNEEPMDIINDILVGVARADGEFVTVPDRKEAIRYCLDHAKDGDVIVLAGKGHEDYQEIKGVKHHMVDSEMVCECVAEGNYPWVLPLKP